MTAVVVLQRASRARWLARRRKGITATDAAVLLGYHPWRTPLDVWLDKLDPRDDAPTFAMLRGRALEGPLADEYERRTGHFVTKPPLLLAHPQHPLMLASLDRDIHSAQRGAGVLELKSEHDRDRAREWWDGDLPDYYASQVLWQLAVTGLDYGVVFADVLGRFEMRTLRRDLDWEADAIPRLLAWWQRPIVARVPPPLDPYRDYVHLSRVWQPEPGKSVAATDAVMGAVQAAAKLRTEVDVLDRLITQMRTQIREHMRTATLLTAPDSDQTVAKVNRRGVLTITYKPTEESTAA